MKKIFLISAFLLSGCIYEQAPAPVNSVDVVEPAQEAQQPTSYSYPLPEQPRSINNVVVNEPQPVQNENIQSNEIIFDSSNIQQINDNNQNINDSSSNVAEQVISDAASPKPVTNSAPVGSFNNPVKFDQSKVY